MKKTEGDQKTASGAKTKKINDQEKAKNEEHDTKSAVKEDAEAVEVDENKEAENNNEIPITKKKEKTNEKAGDEKLQTKVNELNDKYLRLSAEFDNYRKRTAKEKMDLIKTAGEDIFLSMLPVIDDMERALQTIDEAQEVKAVKEGVDLIYIKFKEFLKSKGVKEIEARNTEFDTDLHEAITKIPAPDKKLKGIVLDVIEKGYFLHDKVIRFPKVVIGE